MIFEFIDVRRDFSTLCQQRAANMCLRNVC